MLADLCVTLIEEKIVLVKYLKHLANRSALDAIALGDFLES